MLEITLLNVPRQSNMNPLCNEEQVFTPCDRVPVSGWHVHNTSKIVLSLINVRPCWEKSYLKKIARKKLFCFRNENTIWMLRTWRRFPTQFQLELLFKTRIALYGGIMVLLLLKHEACLCLSSANFMKKMTPPVNPLPLVWWCEK